MLEWNIHALPQLLLPGIGLAYAISSVTEFAGIDNFASGMEGAVPNMLTGTSACIGSKRGLSLRFELMVMDELRRSRVYRSGVA